MDQATEAAGTSGRASAPLSGAAYGGDQGTGGSPPVVLDFVRGLDGCALGHLGVLLDFGDPSMRQDSHPGLLAPSGRDERVEHGGATWLRARSRILTASFYWPEMASTAPDAGAYVEARVRGGAARAAIVAIDGKVVGGWTLPKERVGVVMARASAAAPATLAPGSHELSLRFVGGPRSGTEPLAEIDWLHVGVGDPSEHYAAPTRADVMTDAAVGGRSMRALALRAPGFVRCSGWVPPGSTLEASLATAGGGDADVEARLLRDRLPPLVLGTAHVEGGDRRWALWSMPITGLDERGALASVELIATHAGKGTRVLVGEPRVVAAPPAHAASTTPPARGVVLVVLGSTSAGSLAPWGGPRPVPELTRFASRATLFVHNRAVTSLANADVASMLTGLPPRVHGLDDPDARLPHGATTVEEACRQGGVSTAMFTADPTTGAAFGFARDWDTFTAHDPLDGAPATQVFDDAAEWIEAHRSERFFIVVHARGGHPPWDVPPEALKTTPPDGYFGMIEPRHAAEDLAKALKHPARFKDEDRVRARALYDRAVDAHDAALGRLLLALRSTGRDDDTVTIVTGDVAASDVPPVPFVDVATLDEPLLATPLVVRWPGADTLSGRRVEAPSTPVDLGRTILAALGLPPPPAFEGVDLARLAGGTWVPSERPMAATRGDRMALRWGPFVLFEASGREVRMCELSLDPACLSDVRATAPIALESMRRWAVDHLAAASPSPLPRESATFDEHTTAALVRWGRASDERQADQE